MLSFRQFLVESKNVHLRHLEDSILDDGVAGITNTINFLEAMKKMLSSSSSSKKNLTVKWDGSPAIFAGIDPETGNFFVGTKSVFSINAKLNFTDADIDGNHGGQGDLPIKLKVALKHMKGLGIKSGMIQGDMMFTKNMITSINVDGEDLIAFTPNTITYTVPAKSKLAKQIKTAEFGIVFHTSYTGGPTVRDMKGSFSVNISALKKSRNIWFDDAEFKDVSGSSTFTAAETQKLQKMITNIRTFTVDKAFLGSIPSSLKTIIAQYNNKTIREGKKIKNTKTHVAGILELLRSKKKSKTGKKTKTEIFLEDGKDKMAKIFELYNIIVGAKEFVLGKLNSVKDFGTFIQTADGYRVTDHEGFVAVDKKGNAFKLVDRLEFSRLNFNSHKDFVKGS